ncbi:MAG: amidohydrolase family protein, partial [Acidobacteria bacterium]|nr:amidohydrolase family protein [Acidobacteriota bacterium]
YEPPDSDAVLPQYHFIQRQLGERGVVLGRGHLGVPTFNGVHALWERGELTVRFRMPFPLIPQISGHTVEVPPEEAETLFRRWANMSKIGDNMLRIVGMRIPGVGGNPDGGNSLMLEPKIRPYSDMQGKPAPYGGTPYEQEAMEKGLKETFRGREALIQACRFGWDADADHTVGDRAYREVIKAYEECLKDPIVHRPNQRLTTGDTPMTAPEDIALAAKLGVRPNISTGYTFGFQIEPALIQYGTERVNKWGSIKTFIKAGMHPTLNGIAWIWNGRSAFQWLGTYITRKDEVYGQVWNASEALSRQEALWGATLWAAEQLSEEKELGNIMVGKEADLLVVDKDYMTIPPDEIANIKVLLTMVGGKVVHEMEGGLQ